MANTRPDPFRLLLLCGPTVLDLTLCATISYTRPIYLGRYSYGGLTRKV